MSITGERDDLPGGGPPKAGVAVTDLMTGMYLFHVRHSGRLA
jgi:crotonobetainyl-CoA:carnitine CoA-transferase CaiB-like acyl-CoA transferase